MTRIALLVSAAVVLSSCNWATTGSVRYSGSDPMGPFQGEVSPIVCTGWFQGLDVSALLRANAPAAYVSMDTHLHLVTVSANATTWTFDESACTVFEQRHWFDPPEQLHVLVHIDCTGQASGVHVVGTVSSDNCQVRRP